MEWNVIQKKAYPVLGLVFISTIFVLLTGPSSIPFHAITSTKESLGQIPPNVTISTTIQVIHSPSMIHSLSNGSTEVKTDEESLNQSSDFVSENNSNATSLAGNIHGVEEICDVSKGRWIEEPRGSVYTNVTCSLLPDIKNCGKYGKNPSYLYWRWQPDECDLPRFEPETFLNIVRGKKMAFIGDSLARNQFESLLCLLSLAETPTLTFRDAFDRFQTWHFPSHNFSLMVMWTEFFVHSEEQKIDGKGTNSFDIHLDKMNTNWTERMPSLDYAIISGGNWFFRRNYFYEDDKLIGCVYCKEENLPGLDITFVIRKVLQAALKFISTCKDCEGLVTFIRTFTISHFENGSWFDGGYCNKTKPLNETEINLHDIAWEIRNLQIEELQRIRGEENTVNMKFGLLDVTKPMMYRADAHPEGYWSPKFEKRVNDCLHWCLPGPVDMWSDLLLATIKKNFVIY